MEEALDKDRLKAVYDRKSRLYDLQHALFTWRSDERGRRLVVEHGVSEGDRVLDAGGGTGNTSLLAARRVGTGGSVVVFDLSDGMLETARKKASAAGLAERMTFRTGDILQLPFEDGAFDAVLSTYSMCPLYDPSAGALELYRVVRPGGRLAAAHSVEPARPAVRAVARQVERVVWRFPSLSMGCRPVQTLPALLEAGAELLFQTTIGVPLWPFVVYAVRKPPLAAEAAAAGLAQAGGSG